VAGGLHRIESVSTIKERLGVHTQTAAFHRIVSYVLLLGGVGLFIILVWKSGMGSIGAVLLNVGWSLPLVFFPHILVTVLEALGWWFAFAQKGCPIRFSEILRFTISAKAVQLVTPSISQAGELLKIHLLCRSGVRTDLATASVVSAKTTITISELLFIGSGLVLVLRHVPIDPYVARSASMGILLVGLFVAGLLVWQRLGVFGSLARVSRRLSILTRLMDRYQVLLSSTDGILKEYLGERKRFGLSCLGYFLGWTAGALEAWVFLAMVGLSPDLVSALIVQVWLLVVTRFTAFVPANLGTHEAGVLLIFSLLGFTPEAAMAFAILRRLRQIVWIGAGFALLPRASGVQPSLTV
jgi:uncharacterized protein (TIRG00374 family)